MKTKYTGKTCVACGKIFTENDDVVVCPDCGAPHHRECYNQAGHCALESKHKEGEKWNWNTSNWGMRHEEIIDGDAPMRCPRCATLCKPGTYSCPVCGSNLTGRNANHTGLRLDDMVPPLTEEELKTIREQIFEEKSKEDASGSEGNNQNREIPRQNYDSRYSSHGGAQHSPYSHNQPSMPPIPLNPITTPYGGVAPEEEIEGVPARDLVLYVGPNSHYYLPRFKLFANRSGKVQWNWSAFFFHFIYFFYRKMYLIGGIFLAAYLLIQLPLFLVLPDYINYLYDALTSGSIFTSVPESVQWYINYSYISNFILLALGTFSSLTANRFYFKKVLKDVGFLRRQWSEQPDKKDKELNVDLSENQPPDSQSYFSALAHKGRVNMKVVFILLACVAFINFGLPMIAVFWLIQ